MQLKQNSSKYYWQYRQNIDDKTLALKTLFSGSQEVIGSIPICSTKEKLDFIGLFLTLSGNIIFNIIQYSLNPYFLLKRS